MDLYYPFGALSLFWKYTISNMALLAAKQQVYLPIIPILGHRFLKHLKFTGGGNNKLVATNPILSVFHEKLFTVKIALKISTNTGCFTGE